MALDTPQAQTLQRGDQLSSGLHSRDLIINWLSPPANVSLLIAVSHAFPFFILLYFPLPCQMEFAGPPSEALLVFPQLFQGQEIPQEPSKGRFKKQVGGLPASALDEERGSRFLGEIQQWDLQAIDFSAHTICPLGS